jgi:hypothetical protein
MASRSAAAGFGPGEFARLHSAESGRLSQAPLPVSLPSARPPLQAPEKTRLPKIRFSDLPSGLWQLLERVQEREVSLADLRRLQKWVQSEPLAPDGAWYKDFGSFKLCGSGEYPRTVLTKHMTPFGEQIE